MEARDAERAGLERVSLASVAREELYPWSAGAGRGDSPNLPDSPLTHPTAWDKSLYRSGPPCPPSPTWSFQVSLRFQAFAFL